MSHRFRSAFRGFHRDDVIAYIQKLMQDHREECRQLRAELERTKCELEELRERCAQQPDTAEASAPAEETEIPVQDNAYAPQETDAPHRYF